MSEKPKLPEDYATALQAAREAINKLPRQSAERRTLLIDLLSMCTEPFAEGGVPIEDVSDLVAHVNLIRAEAEQLLARNDI